MRFSKENPKGENSAMPRGLKSARRSSRISARVGAALPSREMGESRARCRVLAQAGCPPRSLDEHAAA